MNCNFNLNHITLLIKFYTAHRFIRKINNTVIVNETR